MTPRPTPIILDVDTGVDDACALLLALAVDADRYAQLWLQTMKESPR